MKRVLLVTALAVALGLSALSLPAATQGLDDPIVKALLSLPHYGVFDNLAYELNGTDVILSGQVLLPITKSEAGRRVARIAGLGKVTNNIEVLPLSKNDDAIRLLAYRSLFGTSDLYKYSLGANPSIHIIVKGGHITLEGVVSSETDAKTALLAIRGVPDSLSQTSHLTVAK
ncbi:MAG: BON domain-containing protein [Candidatus Aminicenantes bacterium]|nr:BON domain-containing protein [Candidatus Aminicenantes bacterium]